MKQHTIAVTVGRDSIQVEPDTLTMTSADEVRWSRGSSGAFSIVFDDERGFGKRELVHEVASLPQRPARTGRFKYTVVSNDDPQVKLDPVIIVEDPPTGQVP
jgi:hypothetical protein